VPGEDRAGQGWAEDAATAGSADGWNRDRDAWDHWDENAWDLEKWEQTAKEKPAVPLPRRNGGLVGRHSVPGAPPEPPADPHDSPMRIEGSPDEVYGSGEAMDWNQMPVAGQGYQVTPVVDQVADTQRQRPVPAAPPSADDLDWWNETSRGDTDSDHHEDLFHGHTDQLPRGPDVSPIPELESGPSFNGFAPAQAAPPEPVEPYVPATQAGPVAQAGPVGLPPEPAAFDDYQDLRPYPGEFEEQHHSGQFARQSIPPPDAPEEPAEEEEGRRIPLLLIAAIVGLVLVGVGVWTKWPRDVSQASPQQSAPAAVYSVPLVPPAADGSNLLPVGPTESPSLIPTTPGTAPTTKKAPGQPAPTKKPATTQPAPQPPPPPPSSPSPSPSATPSSPSATPSD
jgi:hypothetical protein